jgi:hypothetical protein
MIIYLLKLFSIFFKLKSRIMHREEDRILTISPFEKRRICDQCSSCICERVYIINLALNYIDQCLCLKCLASEKGIDEGQVFRSLADYIKSRPCFKAEWDHVNYKECKKYPHCYCGGCDER